MSVADLVATFALSRREGDTFTAEAPAWWGERLFGGMVVAQALRAAARSVTGSLQPHSMHGYFFRPVAPGEVTLVVERVRDSRSFATREVTTVQEGRPAARMTCSFCVREEGETEYQLPMPADVTGPEGLEVGYPPGPFEACDAGVDQAPDRTYRSSGRFWTRTSGQLPEDPGLHACVLALMSDMTRTSFRPASMHTWGSHTDASIDHAVWFHRPARADQWLLFDLQAVVNLHHRATVRGSMYGADGALVLTMAQELLIRPIAGGGRAIGSLTEAF